MSKDKQPEIRFPGFAEDWEERKLGELGEVTTGKAFSSTDFDDQGEYLVITNKDISDSSRSQNVVTDRISISDNEIIKKYNLSGKNILVTMDGVNLGKTAMYSNNKALLAQRVGRIKSNQLNFIYQLTSSDTFLITMRTLSVGNAIKHISLKQISDYSSLVPKDTIEQQKIGTFFKQLDDTIALHQRKLDLLKETKKGFLQKMFPKNGAKVPEIRFPGFTGDWEQRKLENLTNFFSGLTYSPNNVQNNGTLVLRSSNVKNNVIVSADNVYVSNEVATSEHVQVGDVIVVVRNGSRSLIGKHAYIKHEMINTVIGAFMTGLRSPSPKFLNALLDTQQFNVEIQKNLGATINQITTGEFKKMQFTVPTDEDEKEKIGSFFQELDDTIALHQRKLDLLKETKKGFLQKMFV